MLILVAIMEDVAINTPGILKAFFTPGKIFLNHDYDYQFMNIKNCQYHSPTVLGLV